MIHSWRISRTANIKEAFSGEGARIWGGRWNRKGTAMVYSASSRSLALLEILAHIRNSRQEKVPLRQYLFFEITFDEKLLEELPSSSLPSDWDSEPPKDSTKRIGDMWIERGGSVVLSVPSAIVPEERNLLLNPLHPLFARVQIAPPTPCRLDPRLI